MKRVSIYFLMVMLLGLSACGNEKPTEISSNETDIVEFIEDQIDMNEDKNETDLKTEEEIVLTEADIVMIKFLDAIKVEDYIKAYDMLYLEDATYLSVEDFRWYIENKSNFSEIIGSEDNFINIDSAMYNDLWNATINYGESTIRLKAALVENEWKIYYKDFYNTDWELRIPINCTATINGVELKQEYFIAEEEFKDFYLIPAIPKKDIELMIYTECFGNYTYEVETALNYELICIVEDEELCLEAQNALKDMINEMHARYDAGEDKSFLLEYISGKADENFIDELYGYFEEFKNEEYSSTTKNINVTYTAVLGSTEKPPVTVNMTDVLNLNICVEKDFTVDFKYGSDDECTVRKIGKVYLEKTKTGYKIVSIANADFITSDNYMLNAWGWEDYIVDEPVIENEDEDEIIDDSVSNNNSDEN